MNKVYIGIDNGVTASIGIIDLNNTYVDFFKTPTKKEQDYTKAKKGISRIDSPELFGRLKEIKEKFESCIAILERPMLNPTRWTASISAARSLESTLNILELLEIPHIFVDSKQWQSLLLPKGTKGSTELKKASLDIGNRLFPQFKDMKPKHDDRDGILIAEYARRTKM